MSPTPAPRASMPRRVDTTTPAVVQEPYCFKCDLDRHQCLGCGANIEHDTRVCGDCYAMGAENLDQELLEGKGR